MKTPATVTQTPSRTRNPTRRGLEEDPPTSSTRMVVGMVNRSKKKGDRFELEAVSHLVACWPELVSCAKPMRLLGAGRKEDVGDLHVWADTAIQVKAVADMGAAIRSAAQGARVQRGNGDGLEFALGMVPVLRARAGQVRWLAAVLPEDFPGGRGALPDEPVEFGTVSRLLAWVRDDEGPHGYRARPRTERVAELATGQSARVLVMPLEAWVEAYRPLSCAARRPTAA